MSSASARGRSWSIAETKALCVAARNASEQGTADEKELEARVRANFKERLLYMERIGTYPGGDPTLPSAQQAVDERLGKLSSLWGKFQHASAKGIRPEVVNVIMPVVKEVAPCGLGSGKQIEDRLEAIKMGYFNKVKKGNTKLATEATMPAKWTTPAWECFVDFGLPGENWPQFLPDLEAPSTGGKRPNSREAQRKFKKAAMKAEVDGRTAQLLASSKVWAIQPALCMFFTFMSQSTNLLHHTGSGCICQHYISGQDGNGHAKKHAGAKQPVDEAERPLGVADTGASPSAACHATRIGAWRG